MRFRRITSATLLLLLVGAITVSGENKDETTLVFPPYLHTLGIRKATKYHLLLFMQNRVKFRNPQALAVTRLDRWDDPDTKGDDDEVTVYGVNSGQNNIIYNKSMSALGVYGLNTTVKHRLDNPRGIAANSSGAVYVADTGNDRIVRLDNKDDNLVYSHEIRLDNPGFSGPGDVTLDSQDNIYVADTGNNRVVVLDAEGRYQYDFGGIGSQMSSPMAIVVVDRKLKWSYYRDDFIVVIDRGKTRIQKYSLDGHPVAAISADTFLSGPAELMYIACDYYNNIYVTDIRNHCIHKFDRNLQYLTSYGSRGKGDGEFIEPRGIAIHRRFGQIFIAEKEGAQYYWVGTNARSLSAYPHEEKSHLVFFEYFLTEPSFITADVFDADGRFVTSIFRNQFKRSGRNRDAWNGRVNDVSARTHHGERPITADEYTGLSQVPAGQYSVRYTFEATYSSRRHFSKELRVNINIKYE
ncbi:MAG: hypothetical protein V2J62_09820 [candidate division KSB1 bacterium]|nr:hypothetical protein [candidate division KSB1 bacterium]